MAQVFVSKAFYRGETIEGTFGLVQGYTPFKGEDRRNGRKGPGFIKVEVSGEALLRLAPNEKPVKLTVEGDGAGYQVFDATEAPAPQASEPEGLGDILTRMMERAAEDVPVETVRANGWHGAELAAAQAEIDDLKMQMQLSTGRVRDALRKKIARRVAKLG